MTTLPEEALDALRNALVSRPAARRAYLDGSHIVLELDEVAPDLGDYRAEIQDSMLLIAGALGDAGRGVSLSCGPSELFRGSTPKGQLVDEKGLA